MPTIQDGMKFFKKTFRNQVQQAAANTPFTLNFFTALAVQETFEVWGNIFKKVPTAQLLELCVGDTIDGPSRKAFPTSKQALLAIPNGNALFIVARKALEDVGTVNAAYHKIAVANPNKFCHGFGILQYDLQHCKKDEDFFLNKEWADFDKCMAKAISELKDAQKRAGLSAKNSLTDLELAHVAIAYNAGSFNPKKGLKQGFKDASGKFYGELIFEFIQTASKIP